jgi:ABC-type glycerol-3-phosphate transport system substrate-binding protein
MHRTHVALAALLFAGLTVALVGCGGPPPRAVVKGTVSIDGKSLTTGNVMFWGDKNVTATATISESGEYVMNDAPIGDVKITVTVPRIPPGLLEKMQAKSGKFKEINKGIKSVDPESGKSISIMGSVPATIVPIPEKYADVSTSNLTFTVKAGEQTKDLPLTP